MSGSRIPEFLTLIPKLFVVVVKVSMNSGIPQKTESGSTGKVTDRYKPFSNRNRFNVLHNYSMDVSTIKLAKLLFHCSCEKFR